MLTVLIIIGIFQSITIHSMIKRIEKLEGKL